MFIRHTFWSPMKLRGNKYMHYIWNFKNCLSIGLHIIFIRTSWSLLFPTKIASLLVNYGIANRIVLETPLSYLNDINSNFMPTIHLTNFLIKWMWMSLGIHHTITFHLEFCACPDQSDFMVIHTYDQQEIRTTWELWRYCVFRVKNKVDE